MPPQPVIEYMLTFDGQDDWIELPPASIPSGNEITCSFWAYGGEALPRANSVIGAWSANNQAILNIHLIWSDSYVYFDCGSNKTEKSESYDRIRKQINAADCKGKWSHWAFTKNATTGAMKIYFNGELWHQETGKNIPIPQAAKARLGSYFNSHYYPGRLAEVQLWNRERTQAEIQQDMSRRLRGDEPGLVSYWPLNEGSGTIAHDKTSKAYHGTIYGNPRWETSTLSLLPAPPNQAENPATPFNTPLDIEYALNFDGQDDWIEVPPVSIPSGNEITCSFWAYGGEALPRNNSVIGAWFENNQRILNIHLIWSDSYVYFDCGSNKTEKSESYDRIRKQINPADCKGKWSHWAFTKNATTGAMKIYFNGELWHQETGKNIPIPQAAKARLGSYFNSHYYPGRLAEVQLWNRERTQAEIQQDMPRRLRGDEPGLVSYWPLNEGSGTIANDKTSKAYHGTIYGNPRWETSTLSLVPAPPNQTENPTTPVNTPIDSQTKIEYMLTFDGQDDFITCPNGIVSPSYTKEAWVKLAEPVLPSNNILSGIHHAFYLPHGWLQAGHNGQWAQVKDSYVSPANTWFHAAVTYDSQTQVMCLYRDGRLVSQASNVPRFNPSDSTLQIGSHQSSYLFKGQIAEARIWNKALSQAEIQSNLSRRLVGNEPGLVSYWPLNEGSGTIAHDKTSNAHHGTIYGNPRWETSTLSLLPAPPNQTENPTTPVNTPIDSQTKIEYILTFDGQDDSIELPPESIPSGNELTCSFWAYGGEALPKANSVIEARYANDQPQPILCVNLIWNNSCVYFDCGGNNGESYNRLKKEINVADCKGKWSHWAFTKNATTGVMKIYLNGELWHEATNKTLPIPPAARARLGCTFLSQYYPGKLAEFQLWSRERSQAEIQQDMSRRLRGDEPGLVSYWPLNEGSGTIAHDKTSNAHHGIIYGNPRWEASTLSLLPAPPNQTEKPTTPVNTPIDSQTKIEYILTFDGQDDLIELPPATIPSGNEITCSFWAYGGEALPRANSVIEVWSANNQRILNVHLIWNNSCVFFDCGNSGASFDSYDRLMKQINVADCKGKWSHWAFTKNATTGVMKIYLNGELWHQETNKKLPIPQAAKARLGCSFSSQYYPGKLAEFQLWNRERTQAEIQQDMPRRLRGDEPGLVSYWPLNEGSGAIVHDKTSKAYHGTIYGNPRWETSTLSLVPAPRNQTENPTTPVNTPIDSQTKIEYMLTFDGQDDSIELPPESIPSGNELTCSFWAYGGEALPKASSVIEARYANDKPEPILCVNLIWHNSCVYFDCGGNNGESYNRLKKEINVADCKGKWSHWAFTKNATTGVMKIYLNGELWHEGTNKTLPIPPAARARLGCTFLSQYYPGRLAEFQLWSRERTQAEIQQDMSRRLRGDEPGLVSYWPLNEGSGTIAHDKTSNAHHGIIYGNPRWETSTLSLLPAPPNQTENPTTPVNTPMDSEKKQEAPMDSTEYALAFDGSTTCIEIPSNSGLDLRNDFTLEAWVRPKRLTGIQRILSKASGYGFGLRGDQIRFTTYGKQDYDTTQAKLSVDTWVHLAVFVDTNNTAHFYVNSVMVQAIPGKGPANQSSAPFTIGRLGSGLEHFSGQIAEVRVWKGARPEEVQANPSRRLKGDEPGLVGYWLLNEGQGSIVHDKTSFGNHGTIQGNVNWEISALSLAPVSPKPSETTIQEANTPMITQIGPAGSTIAATEFVIQPRTGTPASRIKGISLSSGWAVDKIQVQYENSATNPAEIYYSQAFGGGGGGLTSFSLAPGDYLTSITGTWGAQAAGYPREEIVSLQFHTHQGNHSQVFGGTNPQKQVEPFTLVAPEGSEIIGLFGAYGSHQNALVRLGLYTQPVQSATGTTGINPTFNPPTDSTQPGAGNQGQLQLESAVLQFDGQTNYIEIPHHGGLGLTNNFTVEAWFKAQTLSGYRRIASKFPGFGYGLVDNSLLFTTYWLQDYTASAQLIPGTWYHVAVVFDPSNTAHFYLNGELVQSVEGELPATLAIGNLEIGRKAEARDEHFHGQLAEIRIWSKARTAAAIQAGKSYRLVGDEPNLVGYWPLNEGSGTMVYDKSSHANHGIIRGDAVWSISPLKVGAAELNPDRDKVAEVIPQQVIVLPTTGEQEVVPIPEGSIPEQPGTAAPTEVSPRSIIIEMEPQTNEAIDEFFSQGHGVIYDSVRKAVDQMKAQGTIDRNAVPVFVVISEPVASIAKTTMFEQLIPKVP